MNDQKNRQHLLNYSYQLIMVNLYTKGTIRSRSVPMYGVRHDSDDSAMLVLLRNCSACRDYSFVRTEGRQKHEGEAGTLTKDFSSREMFE